MDDILQRNKVRVIGMTAGSRTHLTAALIAQALTADLLIGGKRHLAQFPEFTGETAAITSNIAEIIAQIKDGLSANKQVVVLASGDPLCFGIGGTLLRYFEPNQLEISVGLSAFQLAFSVLGIRWDQAQWISAHGRSRHAALSQMLAHELCAVLTDNRNTPPRLAADLLKIGLSPETQCAVCENLGLPDQQVHRLTLSDAAEQQFGSLNVFVLWNETPLLAQSPGLLDSAFETENNQITKREIRLAVLGEIGLRPGETLWDIGAGSGSVAIEAARQQPTARVIAIEKSAVMCEHIGRNRIIHHALNVEIIQGAFPEMTTNSYAELPEPDVLFIGGSGGRLREIIDVARLRLNMKSNSHRRIIATFATIENMLLARELLPGSIVYQVGVGRGRPIANKLRFEAINPIFILKYVHHKT